jgi:hypothetical protein
MSCGGGHLGFPIHLKNRNLIKDIPMIIHLQFGFSQFISFREEDLVCKLFTFQASSPKPLGQLEPNIAGMFLGWSSTKLLFFVPVGYSTWLPGPIICSDWLKGIQGLFHQSLVAIGPVVSEEKIFM